MLIMIHLCADLWEILKIDLSEKFLFGTEYWIIVPLRAAFFLDQNFWVHFLRHKLSKRPEWFHNYSYFPVKIAVVLLDFQRFFLTFFNMPVMFLNHWCWSVIIFLQGFHIVIQCWQSLVLENDYCSGKSLILFSLEKFPINPICWQSLVLVNGPDYCLLPSRFQGHCCPKKKNNDVYVFEENTCKAQDCKSFVKVSECQCF